MGAADEEEPIQGSTGGEEKILVSVRLRPLNEKETARNDASDWECINDNTLIYRNNLSVAESSMYPTVYTFDRVFRPDSSTRQVYDVGAKEVALSVVNGINSSIFAYGQTSSGKTYTMGGITEYTVADIYDYINKHKKREFILKFSAMEIYNESVRDLLSMDTTPLRLLDDPERGTIVERLTEETLRDWNHFKELLSICEAQRQIGETSMNETSSRSHQILRLTIESSALEYLGNDKSSILAATVNFVDLAGSERASQSLSAGMRLKEGCHINRSLLTLGTVIRKLSKGRHGHVPFRDSKLTRILQSSLGGNARTAIICTISPARTHVEQSRNTLLFASCAKEVTTDARVNVVVSDKAMVKQLQRELARLESELRSKGSNSGISDSTELLREKDLQIEKLRKEVLKLNQQLELVNSQVENLLRVAEDDGSSTISADTDHHYPKLRVRSSFKSENSVSYSLASEDPRFLDIGIRSFDASQCSAVDNSSNSDENFIQLVDFEENFVQTPELSICTSNLVDDGLHVEDRKELTHENPGNFVKEVQCITMDESSANRYENSQISETSPQRYTESNVSSPNINTGTSGLTEAENEDRQDQELESPQLKEEKELNCLLSNFIVPSPEKPSPWLVEEGMSRTRSVKMIRSRSCRARLMSMPACLFEKVEWNDSTPSMRFEKDLIGRYEGSRRKFFAMKQGHDAEELSRNGSSTSVRSPAVDDHQLQNIENSIGWRSTASVSNSDGGIKYLIDHPEQETKSEAIESTKNVKDVGLDPIQDDLDSAVKWASEFKRLQGEIIELWHTCSVSLIHRTYFFLLFKGDPTDSFYMEIELRKLSFLKNTFSRGNETLVDGRSLSLTSSKRALNQERQMLCRQMQKRLCREERENIFLKWGISLSSSNRRMQLVHNLWTKTTDTDHITESATLVAKLIGFEGQEQTLKEMYGLLNFTPQHLRRGKSSIWRRTVLSIL
ncbi:hypothetical protein P3X46_015907 [Hevea brasiliensis]|uniref:Kinesin-like protein n=1 Tax=Hevea brasiliensis TaxID=3981 RepID=A0ABQ9LYU4_HEVBR|nr:kinesin-like protein KIN-7H [Hevea brasiliensis]XP_058009143.1 kinesin-like protein KIN-7H [Hevea brasiliensis]KAJ9172695.1 hypothetical protein P3X46_015907 [Hevea brasiliensis]